MISFVYFDLGGVVIKDFSGTNKWEELKQEIGISKERSEEFESFWDKYTYEICTERNVETLKPIINEMFGTKIADNYSLLIDGFIKRFEINPGILPAVRAGKRIGKVGLLTNMYPQMLTEIRNLNLLPEVGWDVIIDSSMEKVAKPNRLIYELAENKAGVKGNEILFIENSKKNVEVAESMGWKTYLFDSKLPDESNRKVLEQITRLSGK